MKKGIIYGLLGLGVLGGGAWLLSQPSSPVSSTNIQDSSSDTTCMYSCDSPDKDCSDFSSHSEAQEFFECCGYTETNDQMKLDSLGVGDGVACESLQ